MKFSLKELKQDRARRYKVEKWFWIGMILPTIIWLHDSVLWVSLLSIYALVITAGGAEQAAKAAAESKKSSN